MKIYFDHEKLDAYKKALAFAEWAEPVLERLPKSVAVQNQLDRARTSIVLNIPEGNGRFTPADRCKFFDIARGSALECAGCLDLIFIKKLLSEVELDAGKTLLRSEEHTSELQSPCNLVCRLLLAQKSKIPARPCRAQPCGIHLGGRSCCADT